MYMNYDAIKRLPKMTNTHIHVYALYPYSALLDTVRKIDPETYDKIYYLTRDTDSLTKNTLMFIDSSKPGIKYNETTNISDWAKLSNNTIDFTMKSYDKRAWHTLEKLQNQMRTMIRNVKMYYYLIYTSLHENNKHNVFYLNLRGKPGSITTAVAFGERLFVTRPNNICTQQIFNQKMSELIKNDDDIHQSDLKYMYRTYTRIKCESDIILLAVNNYNKSHAPPSFVSEEAIMNAEISTTYETTYNGTPQSMIQYIITFPKHPKSDTINLREMIAMVKIYIYCCIFINREYAFTFFNGFDMVGNEEETHCLDDYIPLLEKTYVFQQYGIYFIPHIGERAVICKDLNDSESYILGKNITRIGHGLAFLNDTVINAINSYGKTYYFEICPVSNFMFNYYKYSNHPAKQLINHKYVKIMIASDDNGIFGYKTVTHDYAMIIKHWRLDKADIKTLILNGMKCIPKEFQAYYNAVFDSIWDINA